MKFKSFLVEYCDHCSCDYVKVYEDEVGSPELCGNKDVDQGRFNLLNGNKTFVGSKQVRIYFQSDVYYSTTGWQAVFSLGE